MGDGKIRLYHDPIPHSIPTADYLAWAQRGLKQDDLNGRDAAVCYVKRAVCRYIDGLLACNHLGKYLGKDQKEKLDLLLRIDLQIPTIVRDLVINQRNDIEHEYQPATAVQASQQLNSPNSCWSVKARSMSYRRRLSSPSEPMFDLKSMNSLRILWKCESYRTTRGYWLTVCQLMPRS